MKKTGMDQETLIEQAQQDSPQLALEKILTAEIGVAQNVSAAREKADKAILAAQSNQVHVKEQIQADARAQRDKAFKAGANAAREASQKMIASAQAEAVKDTAHGRQFLGEAVEVVMNFLIGQNQEQQ